MPCPGTAISMASVQEMQVSFKRWHISFVWGAGMASAQGKNIYLQGSIQCVLGAKMSTLRSSRHTGKPSSLFPLFSIQEVIYMYVRWHDVKFNISSDVAAAAWRRCTCLPCLMHWSARRAAPVTVLTSVLFRVGQGGA